MTKKNGDKFITQMVLEEVLNDLCITSGREIFVMLPENEDEIIPYLKKEIIKTLANQQMI